METTAWNEFAVMVAGIAASSFAIVRIILSNQHRLLERFVTFLESSIDRQEKSLRSFEDALFGLNETVRDSSVHMARLVELTRTEIGGKR